MKARNKHKDKKKQTVVITTLVTILLLITGTFAWRDYSQHKTNVLSGKGMTRDVVLVEDFEGPIHDWEEGQSVGKKISVRNKGEGDAYIRLKIKEYMEVGNADSKYSNLRYLVDTKGDYISAKLEENATNEDIVKAMNDAINAVNDPSIKEIIGKLTENDIAENYDQLSDKMKRIHRVDDQEGTIRYYIATREDDPNGQYGKHIVIDKETLGAEAKPEDIITGGGTEKKRPDASIEHHEGNLTIDQCELFDHIDYEKRPEQNKASEYVELGYGSVITNLDNNDDNGKWLYDNTSGYFYYTKPLSSKEENPTIGASLSENLLESLKLIVRPEGAFIYEFHVDMEAVSWDEITDGQWDKDTIPEDLHNEWSNKEGEGEEISPSPEEIIKPLPETMDKNVEDTVRIHDRDFNILYKDTQGRALVQSKRNLNNPPGGNVSFYANNLTTYKGFRDSNPQKQIDNWYDQIDAGLKESIYSYRINKEDEEILYGKKDNDYKDENKYYSYPVIEEDDKRAFFLSVSDINKYIKEEFPEEEIFIDNDVITIIEGRAKRMLVVWDQHYWLRSPASMGGEVFDSMSSITGSGYITRTRILKDSARSGVRPSLWVQLEMPEDE